MTQHALLVYETQPDRRERQQFAVSMHDLGVYLFNDQYNDHILKVSWTKERVGIGENELEKLDWVKTSNLCVAWKTDDKR